MYNQVRKQKRVKKIMTEISNLMQRLWDLVFKIEDKYLQTTVKSIFIDQYSIFKTKPAARRHHHNYKHGLLEHSIEVTEMALKMSEINNLDNDIVILAGLLHDIGKIIDYNMNNNGIVTYNSESEGHFIEGIKIVKNTLLSTKVKEILINVIKSHHNLIEWGSLKRPENELEWIIHLSDMWSANVKGKKK